MGEGADVIRTDGNQGKANGTSFSSPVMCGMVACLWQACPRLTAKELAAADFARRGFEVRMFEDEKFAGKMQKVFETKQIIQHGVLGEGVGNLAMVTTDISEAVKGVKYIVIAVPAFGHSYYADLLVDHLEDGQIILILAGTFGSLIFWNKMKKKGIKKRCGFC